VNKGTGLKAALKELAISPQNVVAVGDAENDHALLRMAGCSVAVANALEVLKEQADVVTRSSHGQGVTEICDQLIEDDLASCDSKLKRQSASPADRVRGDSVNDKSGDNDNGHPRRGSRVGAEKLSKV
jgi:3-deoxy-D-manno-octulosonate 8-phosphate phosphatase KdsC-like HAD superfamily phosphatase